MSDNLKSFLKKNPSVKGAALVFLIGLVLMLLIPQGSSGDDVSESASLSAVCSSVEGVGECEVIISYGESGEVVAVAVVCEGADSVSVRKTLVNMIGSLYGIGSNRISVVKSK